MTTITLHTRQVKARRAISLGLAAATLIVWTGMAQAGSSPESFSGLAKKVTPAVVNIASTHKVSGADVEAPDLPFGFPKGSPFEKYFKQFRDQMGEHQRDKAKPRMAVGLGSGFIVDPEGYVVTNNHVVDGAAEVKVRLDDDKVYAAQVIGTDPQTDLALLKIDAKRPLPAVQFGDSGKTEVGDWVMAVGNPFGLGGTVTAGIVSARGRNIDAGPYDDFLQIDAPINQGNSGGPLFNMDGAVIGVNTAIYSPNGGSVGIGFAIPSNIVKSVVAQLKEGGSVKRGWLGVQIQKMTPEIAGALGLKEDDGALVTVVTRDSPASKAGLKQGDVVLSFDGQKIAGPRDLARVVAKHPAGSKTSLTVWRDSGRKKLAVVTGDQPAQPKLAAVQPDGKPASTYYSKDLNAELTSLTPGVRDELGVPDSETGVLVLDVKEGPMLEQGLRAGDIIKKVGQTIVSTPQKIESLIENAKSHSKKVVLMLVSRQGRDLFLGLRLGVA